MSRIRRDRVIAVPLRKEIFRELRVLRATAVLALVGCDTPLSMFSTASESAERVSKLAWFMIVLAAIIFTGVIVTMLAAAARNRHRNAVDVDLSDPGTGWIVWGGAVIPGVVLAAIFVVSLGAMGRYPESGPVVTIHVTGHQWWWQLDYEFPELPQQFRTANEIHIPVGRPVRIILTSADVIHSFWVPQLQGKLDVIPGDTNDLRLVARRPGRYTGACAEYCGAQHAHMGLTVVAEDSTSFKQWAAHQLTDGATPRDSLSAEGRRLFVGGPCALCHTVRGTPALAQVAPDLTHVGSRAMIAAGALPNTLGNLEGWIANAQSLKPGTKMPTLSVYDGGQLHALAVYVASLK
ncbi:MAG TPA: cytochrome c oxidase subunit II [Gemmatimonadaceae bacterium]|jgi:cytochrome c oxidase subunit 2|nr:cytochrome c oxidase subunit II [Gemmatimonadaceae bacterium]